MAKYEVKVNFENLGKDELIAVPGVGEVKNGSTVKVDEFQVGVWENFTGSTWPDDGLVLPAPAPEPNETDAQIEGRIQAAIIERQEGRSAEEARKEEAALTKAILRGKWPQPRMVDGKVIDAPKDPIKAASSEPPKK